MKYVDEFRNKTVNKKLTETIHSLAAQIPEHVSLMEVCGTHTMAMFRQGIRELLPDNIAILSGPGCPVCVTAQEDIDKAIALSEIDNIIITTFGDMIKVPGTKSSLGQMKSMGKDVRVVYSALDALETAQKYKSKIVVHVAVGFETTVPTIAAVLKRAKVEKIKNLMILSAHKIIPPALEVLLFSEKSRISGFLLPGHVSAVIGAMPYEPLVKKFKVPCVISGFEAMDILQSIAMLLVQIIKKKPKVEIQYKRCVKKHGNLTALKVIKEVFTVDDVSWRGLGVLKASGLVLKKEFAGFNALNHFTVILPKQKKTKCLCGEVLQGRILPPKCPFFGKACNPRSPIGPCMVSSEGTCAAYYRYGGKNG